MTDLFKFIKYRFPGLTLELISSEVKKYSTFKRYKYPWEELDNNLSKKNYKLLLVGYGSLINKKSASQTLDKSLVDKSIPVIAFGVKRIFNYPYINERRYGAVSDPKYGAALNTMITYDSRDIMNGVLLSISGYDIDSLKKREKNYDLFPLPVLEWYGKEVHLFKAYVLSLNSKDTDNEMLPHINYYKTCREGALAIDNDFLTLWMHSTFLSDGETNMLQWEQKYINHDI